MTRPPPFYLEPAFSPLPLGEGPEVRVPPAYAKLETAIRQNLKGFGYK